MLFCMFHVIFFMICNKHTILRLFMFLLCDSETVESYSIRTCFGWFQISHSGKVGYYWIFIIYYSRPFQRCLYMLNPWRFEWVIAKSTNSPSWAFCALLRFEPWTCWGLADDGPTDSAAYIRWSNIVISRISSISCSTCWIGLFLANMAYLCICWLCTLVRYEFSWWNTYGTHQHTSAHVQSVA
jgi:hypothetical protein